MVNVTLWRLLLQDVKKTCLVDGSVIRITFNVLFALYDREPCV